MIKEFLEEIFNKMHVDITNIDVDLVKENEYYVNIESDESSLLIGWHGEVINSLQHLLKVILRSQEELPEGGMVRVDVNNYRKRQEESVLDLAEKKAELVRKTSASQLLPPMSPYFRRLVHLHITEGKFDDLITESIGEGNERQIKIMIKSAN